MSLTADLTSYVAIAFRKAGTLVKTLTISSITKGQFDPVTGRYPTTATTFQVEVMDNDQDETVVQASLANRDVRSYIVKAGQLAQPGQKFEDNGTSYTIFKVSPVQQNSTVFVYYMWAEA